MTEQTPEIIPIPVETTGWFYTEFTGPGITTPTKGVPAGDSQQGGVSAAQTWLTLIFTQRIGPQPGQAYS
jgi:hypothetical protein